MQDQFPVQIPRRKAGMQAAPSVLVPAYGSVPYQLNTQASQAVPYRRGNQEAQLLESDPRPSPRTREAPVLLQFRVSLIHFVLRRDWAALVTSPLSSSAVNLLAEQGDF